MAGEKQQQQNKQILQVIKIKLDKLFVVRNNLFSIYIEEFVNTVHMISIYLPVFRWKSKNASAILSFTFGWNLLLKGFFRFSVLVSFPSLLGKFSLLLVFDFYCNFYFPVFCLNCWAVDHRPIELALSGVQFLPLTGSPSFILYCQRSSLKGRKLRRRMQANLQKVELRFYLSAALDRALGISRDKLGAKLKIKTEFVFERVTMIHC